MYLMYTEGEDGTRVYTLKVRGLDFRIRVDVHAHRSVSFLTPAGPYCIVEGRW
jgi:hypothetical protein